MEGRWRLDFVVYTVYIDVVFAVNMIMDIVVLTVLNRVLSYRTTKRRILAGAAIGGLWACVLSLCPGIPAAVQMIGTYVAVSGLMAVTAYSLERPKDILTAVAGIYLTSVVLGGVLLMLRENTRAGWYVQRLLCEEGAGGIPAAAWICLAAGAIGAVYGLTGLWSQVLGRAARRKCLCRVCLRCGGREEQVIGLIDTGNRLREPVTGRPVHVAEEEVMRRLCPAVKGVMYVPYQAVGTEKGMLAAMFLDQMEVEEEGRRYILEKPLVAVLRQKLSAAGEYQMLVQRTEEFYAAKRP